MPAGGVVAGGAFGVFVKQKNRAPEGPVGCVVAEVVLVCV